METQILIMPKTKDQKKNVIDSLKQDMETQKSMVFIDFTGLKVKDMAELRSQLKEQGAKLTVAKKTLLETAAKDSKIDIDFKGMEGQIGAVFANEDEITPVKTLFAAVKSVEGLKVVGGYFENQEQGADYMKALSLIPSRQELLGNLVGTISNPMSGFVRVLNGNIKGLLIALNAISQKG